MAWKFNKRIKVIPGVRINLNKKGISTTIGIKNASLNVSSKGMYLNAGIPGLGSSRHKLSSTTNNFTETIEKPEVLPEPEIIKVTRPEDNIISLDVEEITSQNMQGIKEAILNASKQRTELATDIVKVTSSLSFTRMKLIASYVLIISLISKKVKESILNDINKQKQTLDELKIQKDNSYVNLDVDFDEELKIKYEQVINAFKNLMSSKKVWDVTRAVANSNQERIAARTIATTTLNKLDAKIDLKSLEDIKSSFPSPYFFNVNGADLYFYPTFVVMKSNNGNIGLIDFKEMSLNLSVSNFIETGTVPSDSQIIGQTWAKVNKNGTPDKRFKDNYQIPIVRYGVLSFHSMTGLNEEYQFSNYEATERFARMFLEYQNAINDLKGIV